MVKRVCAAALIALTVFGHVRTSAQSAKHADFSVTETLGLRRFSFPAVASVPLAKGELTDETAARLLLDDREVPAQFTVESRWPDGSVRILAVDFNASPGPAERQTYRLEYGSGVKAAPVLRGLTVTESADAIQIGPIRLGKSGAPLLVSVNYGGERIASGTNGIEITDSSGSLHDLSSASSTTVEIVKRGPLAVKIRYSGHLSVTAGRDVRFVTTVDMPSSKSWVRVSTIVDDPDKRVRALSLHTPLLAALPLVWDFGTEGWTYGVLRAVSDAVDLTETVAPRRPVQWQVRTGAAGKEQLYATSGAGPSTMSGWGHVQDAKTAVAFAVEQFGAHPGTSSISVDGAGHLTFRITPVEATTSHELTVYEHFVSTPVQIGAATSPAAILSPLRIDLVASRERAK